MFYQKQPNFDVYFRRTKTGHNKIKIHLHGFYELHCCEEGTLQLMIGENVCALSAGEAALIFPYQPHRFERTGGKGYFFTFAPELIETFHHQFSGLQPKNNQFSFRYDFSAVPEDSDVYTIKSFLYAMCSAAAQLEYEPVPLDGRALLEKIFLATEAHFRDNGFSLGTLAELLDYDYGYVSKYFLKMTGMKYGYYLNHRRIECACQLLNRGFSGSISDVALECGYSNIRSFNRNFKEIEGRTPAEYLKCLDRK